MPGCLSTNLDGPVSALGTGGTILFASNRDDAANFEIYRVAGDGAALRRLTFDPKHNDMGPVMSPDGRFVAWERENTSASGGVDAVEIWIMNTDGTEPRVLVANGSFNRSPTWLDNGGAIAWASFVSGNWEIYRVPLSGGEPVNLSRSPYADQHPRASPDGTTLAFDTNRDFDFEIYLMDADGTHQRNLTQSVTTDDRFPSWTPDGRQIVWSRGLATSDIYAVESDGSGPRAVIATPYSETHPSVSPDGRQVVFQTDQSPPFGLFVAPFEGGDGRSLVPVDPRKRGSDLDPTWHQ
jgi:TolB protein